MAMQPPGNDAIDYARLRQLADEFTEHWQRLQSFYLDAVAGFAFILGHVEAEQDRAGSFVLGQVTGAAGEDFASLELVNHSQKEYVRGNVSTNTVEAHYSIFKRGMKGVYQHCSEKHLHRYLSEFDFRYSNRVGLGVDDEARAEKALQGIAGKRLTYRRPRKACVN